MFWGVVTEWRDRLKRAHKLKNTSKTETSTKRNHSTTKKPHLKDPTQHQGRIQNGSAMVRRKILPRSPQRPRQHGFSVKGLSTQEQTLFEGKGQHMRHIKFHSSNDVNEEKMAKLLKLVAEKTASC